MAEKITSLGIYDNLFGKIVSGEMPSGTRLKEIELSKQFTVSRTPVREALRMLEQDGLVKILPAQGAVAIALTPDDIEDIYDIRMILELLALDLVGSTLSLQKLSEFHEQMNNKRKQDSEEQAKLDTAFHQYIIDTTNRRYLIDTYGRISRLMQHIRSLGFRNPETRTRATKEHIEMIDAIMIRDIPAAKTIIRRHILNSKTFVISLLHQHNR